MWTTLHVGSSKYHIALTASIQKKYINVEFYVDDDKEIGQISIDNASILEEAIGVKATPFMATKASGVRFFKEGCDITVEKNWDLFIEWQMDKALKLKEALSKIGL